MQKNEIRDFSSPWNQEKHLPSRGRERERESESEISKVPVNWIQCRGCIYLSEIYLCIFSQQNIWIKNWLPYDSKVEHIKGSLFLAFFFSFSLHVKQSVFLITRPLQMSHIEIIWCITWICCVFLSLFVITSTKYTGDNSFQMLKFSHKLTDFQCSLQLYSACSPVQWHFKPTHIRNSFPLKL